MTSASRRGFTLLEVVAALALLGGLLVAASVARSQMSVQDRVSRDRLLAVEGRRAVVLCDDLGAELDPDAMADVTTQLAETAGQLFITGVDVEPFRSRDHALFHVERGQVALTAREGRQNAVSSR